MAYINPAFFSCLLWLALTPAARAQQTPAPEAESGVTVVHPGDNGFAELMRAGDPALEDGTTASSRIMAAADSGAATLAERRAAVNLADFRSAVAEMREALDFTLVAPTYTKADDLWAFSPPLRRLARFLACEMEVQFADGKTLAAVDTFAEGLQLSERAKRWGIAGVTVGQTVEVIVLRPIVRHLNQLSARDCDRLFGLLRAELKSSDPAIEGFTAQKELAHFEIDDAIKQLTVINEARNANGDLYYDQFQTLTTAERQAIVDMRENNPQAMAELRNAAQQRLSTLYDGVADMFAHYPGTDPRDREERAEGSSSMVDRFVRAGSALQAYGPDIVEAATSSRTRLYLLAVHSAILRWRWEHATVPATLDDLHLGPLALDPFTSKPLLYKRIDELHYTLSSAGPPNRDDNGHIIAADKRKALTLMAPGA